MPSALYRQAVTDATRHHARSKTYSGRLLRPHKAFLSAMIDRLGVRSILDVGAGKGEQYTWIDPADGMTMEQAWGIDVRKYDPCWPPYAEEPSGKFDLVICTHTLGSIPIDDMPWFLDRLFGFASKAVFIGEKIGPIKKGVHGKRAGFSNDWSAIEWIEAIAPHRVSDVETHLSVVYRSDHGKFTGRFQL